MKNQILFSIVIIFGLFNSCQKEVIPPVIADFNYLQGENGTVSFFNTSQNADTFEWDFNTGDNSNSSNPTYTFAFNKDYVITLTARGPGGQNSKTATVRITSVPTTGRAAIYTSSSTSGFIDIYVGGVYEGRLTKYFISGSVTCGGDGAVTITRGAGTYPYTAQASNGKWSGNITIVNGKCRTLKLTD